MGLSAFNPDHDGIWVQIVGVFSTVRCHCRSRWLDGKPLPLARDNRYLPVCRVHTPWARAKGAASFQELPAVSFLPLHNGASYHCLGSVNGDPDPSTCSLTFVVAPLENR